MSRFLISKRSILALSFVILLSGRAVSFRASQDNIPAELSRAQSMYFGAQFQEAITLLKTLETRLTGNAQRAGELLQVKLYIGLSHLGMNKTDEAKAAFTEVILMDPKFTLDPKEFSPKVIDLFNQAKAAGTEARCNQVCMRIDSLLAAGNLTGARDQINAAGPECGCTAARSNAMTRSIFDRGKAMYDSGKFADAAKEFAAVLALDDRHDLAREYSNLTQQRLQLLLRQSFVEWRTSFDAREYRRASAAYEMIQAQTNPEAAQFKSQIDAEYNLALSRLLTTWKAACAAGERAKLTTIRNDAASLAPGLEVGRYTVAQMQDCTARVCMKGDPALALARLKTRVNPRIDPSLQRYMTRRIVISIEIDERGDVKVKDILDANDRISGVLKDAVEQWKFNPTIIDNQARCVETQIPISFIQQEME